ncbi:MAG: undecaprenyl-diphosphate phosphatase [Planctomycetaceae bacterium]
MEYVHTIILGLIQGVAEFLPISSSGHLVIAGALLDSYSTTSLPKEGALLEIALHFGTLLSILVVYRNDLWQVLKDFRTLAMIVIATIPVGFAGLLLKDHVDEIFSKPLLAGVALLFTAAFLLIGKWLQNRKAAVDRMSTGSAIAIGLFQAVAIIPGISRSGSTIAAGLACGLKRADAARFSFLIAIPAIGGASVVKMKDFVTGEATLGGNLWPVVAGTVVAFVVGIVALKWLIRLVVADRLHWFAMYCIIAGLATIAWQLSIGGT